MQDGHEETEMLIATHAEKLEIVLMNILQRRQHEMACRVSHVKVLSMCLKYVHAKNHRIKEKEHKVAEIVVMDEKTGVGEIRFRRHKDSN